MSRRQRRQTEAGIRAKAADIRRQVHGDRAKPEPDVAGLVRAELARQRQAEAEERRLAEEARFTGGPCVMCGETWSAEDHDGTVLPGWHHCPRGVECAWCHDWRDGDDDGGLLDRAATILRDEGLAALQRPYRKSFTVELGLAGRLGVGPWCDAGEPPGERWAHLAAVAERLEQRRAVLSEKAPIAVPLDELVTAGVDSGPSAVARRVLVGGTWVTEVEPRGAWSIDTQRREAERERVDRERFAGRKGG